MSFCVTHDTNLQRNALQFLFDKGPNTQENIEIEALGGILTTLNYAWLVNGAKIIIVKSKSGTQIGSWDFAVSLQDVTATIISVDEIQRPHRKEPLLAISINCDTSGGIICIFDFVGSKVLRSIQIGEYISNLHVINGAEDFNLSGPLTNFDGIFALGTLGGNIYIVDICRQLFYEGISQLRDETNPCQLHIVGYSDLVDIENHKKNAVCNEAHLAIHLNLVGDNKTEHFVLKAPDGKDKVHVNKKEVSISALHYCPQLGSILVGYNFGAFQLWDLMVMELIYTSPICEDHVPVSKFAIQEPADDPRAFCYIWAVYSSDDLDSSLLPYLVMYALCYESKEFHEAHGILYENFQYCAVRFQMELGFNDNMSNVVPKGGKCLKLESLMHKNSTISNERTEDLLSLCFVTWRAVCENGQFTYMSVFDLNQWYKAQMPNSSSFDECLSYMMTLSVTDLTNTVEKNALVLDIAVNNKAIEQFIATLRLEEHYYPSALSFDTSCLLYDKFIVIRYQGVQKALLYQIHSDGPFCLIRPTDIYQEIVTLGMIPLFCEISANSPVTISLNSQREVILNVALEQQLMNWLCKCVSEWANGSFSAAGCSLDLLISWAHQRWLVLKNNCEKLYVPLFDYSNLRLDTNTMNILNNCIRQLKNISFFYQYIVKNYLDRITDSETLLKQSHMFQMAAVYYDVLQWLLNVGLLPEHSPASSGGVSYSVAQEERVVAPYPAEELVEFYRRKRSELQLNSKRYFSSMKSFLFIDNLIDIECGGDRLVRDWREDEGDGFYPPRSLQALLRTYLVDEIDMNNKHLVVIYLFLDLARVLDSQRCASVITHLIKFPAVFKVSPSLIKITQGFWQLDHDDFNTAMEHLLDPLINKEDVKNWHHRVALRSLIVQEQYNNALYYMRVKKPPILDDEDVLSALSLYVANNLLDEAFHLQKCYSNYPNSRYFVRFLFEECSRHGFLDKLIQKNLSEDEEKLFLDYLDEINHPEVVDLKITYFMQKAHYLEAFRTYEACGDDPSKKGLLGRLRAKTRDQIVHTYKKILPTVSYKFIEQCMKEPNPMLWKEVSKQEPMSSFIHKMEGKRDDNQLSFYLAALVKAKQTFNGTKPNSLTLMKAKTEEIPFLRTPTTLQPRKRSLSSCVKVLVPKIVESEEIEDYDGPSPSKRPRLVPKTASINSFSGINVDNSIINTPIIKRKDSSYISPIARISQDLTATPTSILKNTSVISGRRSISRNSTVRFDVPKTSPSSEEPTPRRSTSPREKDSRNSSRDSISFNSSTKSNFSRSLTPKNESDDVFYSPNSSSNNIEELPKDTDDRSGVKTSFEDDREDREVAQLLVPKISPKKSAIVNEAKLVKLVDYESSSSSEGRSSGSLGAQRAPRARRSLKAISDEKIQSSRSEEATDQEILETDQSVSNPSDYNTTTSETSQNHVVAPKIKPRKSLSRQVLENNAFARFSSSTTSLSSSFKSEEKSTISSVEMDQKNVEFVSKKVVYSDVYRKESGEEFEEKHSVEKSSISIREVSLESDNEVESSSSNSMAVEQENEKSMEELIEDLRERRSKGLVRSYEATEEEEDDQSKSSRTIRRSARLSAERKMANDDLTSEKDKIKISKARKTRASAEKSLLKNNTSSPRVTTRRMSEERTFEDDDSSSRRTRSSSEREVSSPRMTRRLSAERTNSSNSIVNSRRSSSEREISSPRVTRRSSAERSLNEEMKIPEKETVELLKLTPRSKTPTKSLSRKVLVNNALQRIKEDRESKEEEKKEKETYPEKNIEEPKLIEEDEESVKVNRETDPDLAFLREKRISVSNHELSLSDSILELVNNYGTMKHEETPKRRRDSSVAPKLGAGDNVTPKLGADRRETVENVEMVTEEAEEMLQSIKQTSLMFVDEDGGALDAADLTDDLEAKIEPEMSNLEEMKKICELEEEEETLDVYGDFTMNEAEITDDLDDVEPDVSKKTLDVAFFVEEGTVDSVKTIEIVSEDLGEEEREFRGSCSSEPDKAQKRSEEYVNHENVECNNEWNLLENNIFGRLKTENDDHSNSSEEIVASPSLLEKNVICSDSSLSENDEVHHENSMNKPSEVIELNTTTDEEDSKSSSGTSIESNSSNRSSSGDGSTSSRSIEGSSRSSEVTEESKNEEKMSVGSEDREEIKINNNSESNRRVTVDEEKLNEENESRFSKNRSTYSRKKNVELKTGKSEEKTVESVENYVELTPSRRRTRRSSNLSDEEKITMKLGSELNQITPKRSRRPRLSVDPASPSVVNLKVSLPTLSAVTSNIRTYSRKRTKSVDTVLADLSEQESQSGTSRDLQVPLVAKRKLRSASVDMLCFTETAQEQLKKSDDTKDSLKGNRKKSASVCELPVISEEGRKNKRKPDKPVQRKNLRSVSVDGSDSRSTLVEEEEKEEEKEEKKECLIENESIRKKRRKPEKTVKKDLIESYTLTRRMTRRQVDMMEKCLKTKGDGNLIDLPEETDETSNLNEEQRKVDVSPSSSNTSYTRRTRKSSSVASEISDSNSPIKKNKNFTTRVNSPVVIERRKRLRSASSESTTDGVGKVTRSRRRESSESESSKTEISGASTSNRKSKKSESSSTKSKRRGGTVKRILPQIKEENSSDC